MDDLAEIYQKVAAENQNVDPKQYWLYFEAGKTPGSTKIANEFIPLIQGTVLDLGSADGTKQLEELGIPSIHLDLNLKELVFGKSKDELNSAYIAADAEKLPFKDESFDTVLALGLLGALNKNQRVKILDEVMRVTKDGGHLYTAQFKRIEGDPKWEETYKRDAAYLQENGSIFVGWESGKVKFVDHHFTEEELRNLLSEHNLKDIKIEELQVQSQVGGRTYSTLCAWGTK